MSTQLDLRPEDRLLVLAPHPDDETLGAGGLLVKAARAGAEVRVVFATDGENNPWPQRMLERRWRIRESDRLRWGSKRRTEALRALECLGISNDCAVFLGLPDQGLSRLLKTYADTTQQALSKEISAWRPTIIVAPSLRDRHPDHNALAVLVALILNSDPHRERRARRLDFLIHGSPSILRNGHRAQIPLGPEDQEKKRQAVLSHRTQLLFHRRFFLGSVRGTEELFAQGAAARIDAAHPVRDVLTDDRDLRLRMEIPDHPIAFGPKTLLLAGNTPSGTWVVLKAAIPSHSDTAEVRHAATGKVIGKATYAGGRSRGELCIPRSLLKLAQISFVKVEHRFGFFDLDGWRALPPLRLAPPFSTKDRPEKISWADSSAPELEPA